MERFIDITGYDGYQVSNLGRIKSVKGISERILNARLGVNGYLNVGIGLNNKTVKRNIHQLVAIAFLGHIPCGMKRVVDHINSDKLDNRVENLRIATQRENTSVTYEDCTSKYTGVHWNKKSKKWRSCIVINKKQTHLGMFTNEYEAHMAYINKLAKL